MADQLYYEKIDLWLDAAKEFWHEIPKPKGRRQMFAWRTSAGKP